MRFALITTVLAAAVAAPLAVDATGPSMSRKAFLAAVRCEAYSSLPQLESERRASVSEQVRLNGEAMRQAAATAATAKEQASAIYAHAATASAAQLRQERNNVCGASGAMIANRVLAPGAV